MLGNLHLTFDCVYCGQKLGEDFAKFFWPSKNIWTLVMYDNNIPEISVVEVWTY